MADILKAVGTAAGVVWHNKARTGFALAALAASAEGVAMVHGSASAQDTTIKSGISTPEVKTPIVTATPRREVVTAVNNQFVDQAPEGVLFHPMCVVNGQTEVWSYGIAMQYDMPTNGVTFYSDGVGQFTARMDQTDATVQMTIATDGQYINDYRQSHTEGGNYPAAMWFRVEPGTVITVLDVNGKPVENSDGTPMTITANENGDAGIVLPNDGTMTFSYQLHDSDKAFEAKMWFGPDDRSNIVGINKINPTNQN